MKKKDVHELAWLLAHQKLKKANKHFQIDFSLYNPGIEAHCQTMSYKLKWIIVSYFSFYPSCRTLTITTCSNYLSNLISGKFTKNFWTSPYCPKSIWTRLNIYRMNLGQIFRQISLRIRKSIFIRVVKVPLCSKSNVSPNFVG